jgi:hypothetical protein
MLNDGTARMALKFTAYIQNTKGWTAICFGDL